MKSLLAPFVNPGFDGASIGAPGSGVFFANLSACGPLVDQMANIFPLVDLLFGRLSVLFKLSVFFAILYCLLWGTPGDLPVDSVVVAVTPYSVVDLLEAHFGC